jgi:hypothetical protein
MARTTTDEPTDLRSPTLLAGAPDPHQPSEDAELATMLGRLNRLSTAKQHDAYNDVPWDESGYEIWNVEALLAPVDHDPMYDTEWYRQLPEAEKVTFACYRVASSMKSGWQFENILQQGLLRMAARQPNGAKTFRYMHHEIIEESQHTLMFQEFVDRTGLPVQGMERFWRVVGPSITLTGQRIDPALFFTFVLGGEEPIDYSQRLWLQQGIAHPLVERIVRIHVAEEARHISFARRYVENEVPKMGLLRRRALAVHTPIALAIMARMMLQPTSDLRRHLGLPSAVVDEAFQTEKGQALLSGSVAKIQRLWEQHGLMTMASERVWKSLGIWSQP